jgi:(p)ppGpp synthase/HD superfamily hydrolase
MTWMPGSVEHARELARDYHTRAGKPTYVYDHLDEVARLAFQYYGSSYATFNDLEIEPILIISYLHDTLEDTDLTYEEISYNFGTGVATIVRLLTDADGETRAERKRLFGEKMRSSDAARFVKQCDRLQNMQRSYVQNNIDKLRMYCREYDEFRKAVVFKDTELMHALDAVYRDCWSKAFTTLGPDVILC